MNTYTKISKLELELPTTYNWRNLNFSIISIAQKGITSSHKSVNKSIFCSYFYVKILIMNSFYC